MLAVLCQGFLPFATTGFRGSDSLHLGHRLNRFRLQPLAELLNLAAREAAMAPRCQNKRKLAL